MALFEHAAVVPWTGVKSNDHDLTESQLLLKNVSISKDMAQFQQIWI